MAQPITTEECVVLEALLDLHETVIGRTVSGLARRIGEDPRIVERTLRELEARTPAFAEPDPDPDLEVQAWRATEAGRENYVEACG